MPISWGAKRQLLYLAIVAGFFIIVGIIVIPPYFKTDPTCFDHEQNGSERGIDCGGSCLSLCSFEVNETKLLWSRAFEIVPGRYNAVAYLENQNTNAGVKEVNYEFKFYNKDNLYIGNRTGKTFIGPSGKFAVFEGAINLGSLVPARTEFSFLGEKVWTKIEPLISEVEIFNVDNEFSAGGGSASGGKTNSSNTKLSTILTNKSIYDIPYLEVVAIFYDASGNAINSGKTYLENFKGNSSRKVFFTWPSVLNEPQRIEIISKFNPFVLGYE